MPGSSYEVAVDSYVAFFKESTFGTMPATAATGATYAEFLSCGFRTDIEGRRLDTLGHRGFTKRVQLNKEITGTLESHLHPIESVMLVANAMGGSITSSSLTSAYTHSISVGMMQTGVSSLAFNIRKGEEPFQFVGGRVNSLKITAAVGEPIVATYDFIFKDSTIGTTDIASSQTLSSVLPYTFVNGVFRYNSTEAAAATTTSQEEVVNFELTINNQLVSDANARALGANILSVLPPTRKSVELTTTQRFDTTTAYDRFLAATIGAIELKFSGSTITSEHNYDMTVRLPKVYNNSPDPELAASTEVLISEIAWDVVADTGTTAGREIGVTVINDVASY